MADKSLARQVFPPGLVGDLLYKASQMMPMNAFAGRMQAPPQQMQGQMPQQMPQRPMPGQQMYNPDAGSFGAPQMQHPPMQMPPNMPQQMGGPRLMPPNMAQPGMQPQLQNVQMPPNQNIFSQRMARY